MSQVQSYTVPGSCDKAQQISPTFSSRSGSGSCFEQWSFTAHSNSLSLFTCSGNKKNKQVDLYAGTMNQIQDCIPVGCIPPACCPHLPACTALGGGCLVGGGLLPGDRGVPGLGGCLVGGGLFPGGSGGVPGLGGCLVLGVSASAPPCEQNHRHV